MREVPAEQVRSCWILEEPTVRWKGWEDEVVGQGTIKNESRNVGVKQLKRRIWVEVKQRSTLYIFSLRTTTDIQVKRLVRS